MSWVPKAGGIWAQRQQDLTDTVKRTPITNLLREQERSQKRLSQSETPVVPQESTIPVTLESTISVVKAPIDKALIREQQFSLLRALLTAGKFEEWRQKKEEFGLFRMRRNKNPNVSRRGTHVVKKRR